MHAKTRMTRKTTAQGEPWPSVMILSNRKSGFAYVFFVGAIRNTTVTIAYKPYKTQVTVLLQGKLISGWFNANTTKAMAIATITKPIILETIFFIQSHSLVRFKFI